MTKARKWLNYLLPLFIVLFFYLNNLNRFGHLLLTSPVFLLFIVHTVSAYVLLLICLLLFRKNRPTAFLCCSLALIFFFAFGALQDFLFQSQWKPFQLLSNTILLTAIFLAGISLLLWWLRSNKTTLLRLNHFLLLVFAFFLVYELGYMLLYRTARENKLTAQPLVNFSKTSLQKDSLPDIYHLLLDSYTSNQELAKYWQYNNPLYNRLDSLGFFTIDSACSNYSLTALSLNAAFNMHYLQGTKKERVHSFDNFLLWSLNLENNNWFRLLQEQQYKVQLHSLIYEPFSTKATGNMVHESPASWLRMQTFEKTVFDPWRRNQLKKLVGRSEDLPASLFKKYTSLQQYNLQTAKQVTKDLAVQDNNPCYAFYHFLLPHYPYLFDASGKALPVNMHTLGLDPKGYLEQVKYSNLLIDSLVTQILARQPAKRKIIIISGDHGFKDFQQAASAASPYQTICAIYFSDRQYANLPHQMSLVNLYRIIANKAFQQQLPLLQDSIVRGE